MEAIIIVAHGSKLQESNKEIQEIVNSLKLKNQNIFYAFLEFEKPHLRDLLKELIDKKYKIIKILPYFLACGKHVSFDIPNIVKYFDSKNTKIIILKHLGKMNGLNELIIKNISV